MGTLLDTTVFIGVERAIRALPAPAGARNVWARLEEHLDPTEPVAIATVTASELLHGVHRATPEYRARREAFVEAILAAFPPVPFDLLTARVHARIWADLAAKGHDVGAHDRIIAATALAAGWKVGTANPRHFTRISGLEVAEIVVK